MSWVTAGQVIIGVALVVWVIWTAGEVRKPESPWGKDEDGR